MKALVYIMVFVSLALVSIPTLAEAPPQFLMSWGSQGSAPGQFNYLWNVSQDHGYVYAIDTRDTPRIEKFTSGGVFLFQWGSYGGNDGQFSWPGDLAFDMSGNVYVADAGNSRIEKFTSDGVFLAKWGSPGTGDAQFNMPLSVSLSANGDVYVLDYYSFGSPNYVKVFSPDGQFIRKWPVGPSWDPFMQDAWSLEISPSDEVFVAFANRNMIKIYGLDGAQRSTRVLGSTPLRGTIFPEFMGFGPDQSLYVFDGQGLVVKYSTSGDRLTYWGPRGTQDENFIGGLSVTVDSQGFIYVGGDNKIYKFGNSTIAVQPTSWSNLKTLFR
jgi:DNA-binding beta-propeller fold protein YncE